MTLSVICFPKFTLIWFLTALVFVSSNPGVFNVKYRYPRLQGYLSALKEHDDQRQLTILAGIDLPLGGIGRPDIPRLYYAKIGIGTPAKSYYVQVDTGSDIMWVNCIQCKQCPRHSSLGRTVASPSSTSFSFTASRYRRNSSQNTPVPRSGIAVARNPKDATASPKPVKESGNVYDDKLVEMINTKIVDRSPSVKWDDVAGFDGANKALLEMVISERRKLVSSIKESTSNLEDGRDLQSHKLSHKK